MNKKERDKINGWQYYNGAAIPTTAPHEEVDLEPIKNGNIWRLKGRPLLARWTSEWDNSEKTEWWYVIKDTPFDISTLKSKRRYEIKKGLANFTICEINPEEYMEELFYVSMEAYKKYPNSTYFDSF